LSAFSTQQTRFVIISCGIHFFASLPLVIIISEMSNSIFQVFHVVHFECPAQLDAEVKKEETADGDEGPSGDSGTALKEGSGDESDVEDSREAEVFHSTEQ
jgi:hypothetical protein